MEQENFKIFIGGLSKKTNEQNLLIHLEKYGEVISLNLKKKKSSEDCVGYGHATVQKDTYFLLINKGCSIFRGQKITFGPYLDGNNLKSHLEKLNSKRIFVRDIPVSSTGSSLETLFSSFGAVETAYLRAVPGKKTPIGVILFVDPKNAEGAVKMVNEDSTGDFKDMSATYKFLQGRKGDSKGKFTGSGIGSQSNGRSWNPKSMDTRPGKKGYCRTELVEENHNFGNLMLNEGYPSKLATNKLFGDNHPWSTREEHCFDAFHSYNRNSQHSHFCDFARTRVGYRGRENAWNTRYSNKNVRQHANPRFHQYSRSGLNHHAPWNNRAVLRRNDF